MADLTSLYKNKPKRDFSIQACADCINKIALQYPIEFRQGYFTDYFDIAGGTQPPKSTFLNEQKEGYIKFLQIRDFSSDTTPTFIPISKNNKLCTEDDLVLGRYGASVGKILTGKAGAYNVACAKIIFIKNNEVDKDFLFYWLHSSYFQNFLTSISRSAQGGFNKNDLSRIQTLFPSIEIQRKLTSILKSIDLALLNGNKIVFNQNVGNDIEVSFKKLVENFLSFINEGEGLSTELSHQVTLVKKLRQQLLQDAVQGKLIDQNPKNEPASELLKKIKAEKEKLIAEKKLKKVKELTPIKPEEIPFEIPENWVWCSLGEILTEIKYGTSQRCDYDSTKNSKVLRIPNVSNGVLDGDDLKYTNLSEKEKLELALEKNDILIIRSNGSRELVGKTVLVTPEFIGFAYAGYLVRFRFNKILTNPKYLLTATTAPFFRELIETPLRTTVGINNINTQEMSNLYIPLPPLAEQNRIVQKLDELMQYCNELEESIKQSESQNEKLLQQVLREALRMVPEPV